MHETVINNCTVVHRSLCTQSYIDIENSVFSKMLIIMVQVDIPVPVAMVCVTLPQFTKHSGDFLLVLVTLAGLA